MDTNVKACILTAHNGKGWYPKGQKRLINSLRHHGFRHDIVAIECTPIQNSWLVTGSVNGRYIDPQTISGYKSDCVYTLKAAAFDYVRSLGYDTILWLDCSVWAIKDPEPIFDIISHTGHYFWRSGFTLGQTCSDKCLDYFMFTREKAHKINDCSTSMFGLKVSNPDSAKFLDYWLKAAADGMFHGSRDEIPGRGDHEQKFMHRQDQSVASCLIPSFNMKIHQPGQYSQYADVNGDYPESVVLVMAGM